MSEVFIPFKNSGLHGYFIDFNFSEKNETAKPICIIMAPLMALTKITYLRDYLQLDSGNLYETKSRRMVRSEKHPFVSYYILACGKN